MDAHQKTAIPNSRRKFFQQGSLLATGTMLAHILRLRAASANEGATPSPTAAIFIALGGGPSQFETYDPKPNAPVEYRGAFRPIATALPGVQFCELFPLQAAMANRLAVIRSLHHEQASHIAQHIVETGYDLRSSANSLKGEMPSVGAIVSKVRGRNSSGIPSNVSLPQLPAYAGAHWLGAEHHRFAVNDDPNAENFQVSNLSLNAKLDLPRLQDRQQLRSELDHWRRSLDRGESQALDVFSRQAFDLITGPQAQQAFDINREPAKLREQYGRNPLGQRLLLARRLIEAGVPYVTVHMADWDDHERLPERIQKRAPILDQGITTLIDDLQQRGMNRNVLVAAMGEFGRTPRVNPNAGRDHWPGVNVALVAGGRYRMGQVIGASDELGAVVAEAPYRPQNVLAAVYRHLGIDPARTFVDYSGRPRHILEERREIKELV